MLSQHAYVTIVTKKRSREVFASLGSSHGFLSMIFGILGKFWIDIDKNILQKNIFSRSKNFREKTKIVFFMFFRDFQWFPLVNQLFPLVIY